MFRKYDLDVVVWLDLSDSKKNTMIFLKVLENVAYLDLFDRLIQTSRLLARESLAGSI